MTLVQLYYVVALDTHRHFRQAASYLGISQPALSTQLNRLEEELGISLFNRSAKPVVPTHLGKQVVAQARIVLDEVERLRSLVESGETTRAEHLQIGVCSTVAPQVLASALSVFCRQNPQVSVDVQESSAEEILEAIQRDSLDAGLVGGYDTSLRGIRDRRLFTEPLVCYVSKEHPLFQRETIGIEDLDPSEVWVLKPGHSLRNQVLSLFDEKSTWRRNIYSVSLACDSIEVLKRMIEENQGITILPLLAVSGEMQANPKLIRKISTPILERTVRLLYRRRLERSPLIQSLAHSIQQVVQPLLPGGLQVPEMPTFSEQSL